MWRLEGALPEMVARGEWKGDQLGRHENVVEVPPTCCLGHRDETPKPHSQEATELDESMKVWVGLGGL